MLKRFINQFPSCAIKRNEDDSIGEFSVSSSQCVLVCLIYCIYVNNLCSYNTKVAFLKATH